jgi:hypothetical protein
VRWVPLGSGPGVTMDDVDALIGTPQGYVAALATEPATVAVSEDGDAWEMVRLDRDPDAKSTVTTLATDGRRILAVGGSSRCPHEAFWVEGGSALTWISDDGQTWTLADARELTEDSRDVRLFASGPAGTIGLGCDDEMCGGVQAWRLETGSAPAT